MKRSALIAALLGALALPVAAQTAPPLSAMIAALEDQGYRVVEVDVDDVGDDDIEVEARSRNGREVELTLDPRNGAILARDD